MYQAMLSVARDSLAAEPARPAAPQRRQFSATVFAADEEEAGPRRTLVPIRWEEDF